MRLALTALVFLAGIAAVVLVHAPRAHAGWSQPEVVGSGHSPQVRLSEAGEFVAIAAPPLGDPPQVRVIRDGRPLTPVAVPARGHLTAFDVDGDGDLIALRQGRRRMYALVEGRWRVVSRRGGRAVSGRLAVAPSGAAAAIWLQYDRSGQRVHVNVAVRGANARRFSAPRRISGRVFRRGQPLAVAVDDAGDAAALFVSRKDLHLWRLGMKPVKLHGGGSSTVFAHANATVAVGGGNAVVAFTPLFERDGNLLYRAVAATAIGAGRPVLEPLASPVQPQRPAVEIDGTGRPSVVTVAALGGGRYEIALRRREAAGWAPLLTATTGEEPSTTALGGQALAWTEFAPPESQAAAGWAGGTAVSLGAAEQVDVAASGDRVTVAAGGAGQVTIARFTP